MACLAEVFRIFNSLCYFIPQLSGRTVGYVFGLFLQFGQTTVFIAISVDAVLQFVDFILCFITVLCQVVCFLQVGDGLVDIGVCQLHLGSQG